MSETVETVQSDSKPKVQRCETCKTFCVGDEDCKTRFANIKKMDEHLKGDKHKVTMKFKAMKGTQVAKIQSQVERTSDPLLGLSLVLEVWRPLSEPLYRCILCNLECAGKTVMSHLIGNKHFNAYIQAFHPSLVSKMPPKKKIGNEAFEEFLLKSGINLIKEKIVVATEKEASDITSKICKSNNLPIPSFNKSPGQPTGLPKEVFTVSIPEISLVGKKKKKAPASANSQNPDSKKDKVPQTLEEEIAFCKEPLLGLSLIMEVISKDGDWFYCIICEYCCLKHEVVEHVISEKHRKKYILEFHEKMATRLNSRLQMENYIATLTESKQKDKITLTTEQRIKNDASIIIKKKRLHCGISTLQKILDQSRQKKLRNIEDRGDNYERRALLPHPSTMTSAPPQFHEQQPVVPIDPSFQVQYPLPLKYRQQAPANVGNSYFGFGSASQAVTKSSHHDTPSRISHKSSSRLKSDARSKDASTMKTLSKLDQYFGFSDNNPDTKKNSSEFSNRKRSHVDDDYRSRTFHHSDKHRKLSPEGHSSQEKIQNASACKESNVNDILLELLKMLLAQHSDSNLMQSLSTLQSASPDSNNTLAAALLLIQNAQQTGVISSETNLNINESPNVIDYGHSQQNASYIQQNSPLFNKEVQDRLSALTQYLNDSKESVPTPVDSQNQNLLKNTFTSDIDSYKSGILSDLLKMNEIAGLNTSTVGTSLNGQGDSHIVQQSHDSASSSNPSNTDLLSVINAGQLSELNLNQTNPFNMIAGTDNEVIQTQSDRVNSNPTDIHHPSQSDISSTPHSNTFNAKEVHKNNTQTSDIQNTRESEIWNPKTLDNSYISRLSNIFNERHSDMTNTRQPDPRKLNNVRACDNAEQSEVENTRQSDNVRESNSARWSDNARQSNMLNKRESARQSDMLNERQYNDAKQPDNAKLSGNKRQSEILNERRSDMFNVRQSINNKDTDMRWANSSRQSDRINESQIDSARKNDMINVRRSDNARDSDTWSDNTKQSDMLNERRFDGSRLSDGIKQTEVLNVKASVNARPDILGTKKSNNTRSSDMVNARRSDNVRWSDNTRQFDYSSESDNSRQISRESDNTRYSDMLNARSFNDSRQMDNIRQSDITRPSKNLRWTDDESQDGMLNAGFDNPRQVDISRRGSDFERQANMFSRQFDNARQDDMFLHTRQDDMFLNARQDDMLSAHYPDMLNARQADTLRARRAEMLNSRQVDSLNGRYPEMFDARQFDSLRCSEEYNSKQFSNTTNLFTSGARQSFDSDLRDRSFERSSSLNFFTGFGSKEADFGQRSRGDMRFEDYQCPF